MNVLFYFITALNLLQLWFYVQLNKISALRDAIALQEPARLLQHLCYFIAHETTPLQNTVQELSNYVVNVTG